MPYAVEFQRHKNTFDIHNEQTLNCFYKHWITKILIAVNTYYSSQITFRECDNNIWPNLKLCRHFTSLHQALITSWNNVYIRRYTPLWHASHFFLVGSLFMKRDPRARDLCSATFWLTNWKTLPGPANTIAPLWDWIST